MSDHQINTATQKYSLARRGYWFLMSLLWRACDKIGLSRAVDGLLQQKLDQKIAAQLRQNKPSSLYAFCDLAAIPLSFDICYLLASADQARCAQSLTKMTIVFVADESDPGQLLEFTPPLHQRAVTQEWRHFLFNLGVEMTRIYPSVGSVLVLSSRRDVIRFMNALPLRAAMFPSRYSPYRPDYRVGRQGSTLYYPHHILNPQDKTKALQPVKAPKIEIDLVKRWLCHRAINNKFVTITLRDTANIPERNSNIAAWQVLIDHYQGSSLRFVVIDDYFRLFEDEKLNGKNVVYFDAPLLSPAIRLALYERATFNLFTANGPAILCMLSKTVRFAAFGMGCGGKSSTQEDVTRQYGLKQNEEPSCFQENQRLIWHPDNEETLLTLGVELIDKAII